MKLVRPTPKNIEIGNDELGFLTVLSKKHITIAERQAISDAQAKRPTDDQLVKSKAESLLDRGFDYNLGDLIDYISNRESMAVSIRETIDANKLLQETLEIEAPILQRDINLNLAIVVQVFLVARLEDREIANYISGLEPDEFAYGNDSVREEFGDADVCGFGLRSLLDHVTYFYIAESRGVDYHNMIKSLKSEDVTRFF